MKMKKNEKIPVWYRDMKIFNFLTFLGVSIIESLIIDEKKIGFN
jgi:hypothetical protein